MFARIWAEKDLAMMWVKSGLSRFVKEERGDFGIGQLAMIVGTIVIVGVIISVVSGAMEEWVGDLWSWIGNLVGDFTTD